LKTITSEDKFLYKIVLKNPLPLPLVKERNFKLDLELVDYKTNEPVRNMKKFVVLISIYSSENPPKLLEFNTAGNCILKGHSGKFFNSGECSIEK